MIRLFYTQMSYKKRNFGHSLKQNFFPSSKVIAKNHIVHCKTHFSSSEIIKSLFLIRYTKSYLYVLWTENIFLLLVL